MADFKEMLMQSDPDRTLSSLFARPETRQKLQTLYAFNFEISRIAEATTESLIGEMKLTFWSDALDDLYANPQKIRHHDVIEAISNLTGGIYKNDLEIMIDARLADVRADPYQTFDDVLAYVDNTSGKLIEIACGLANVEIDPQWIIDGGRAWGLTGLLRAFAHRAAIGRAPLGLDSLDTHAITLAMLAQGLGSDKVALALLPVHEAAIEALSRFKAHGPLPADAVPLMGYIALCEGYLKNLDDQPYHVSAPSNLISRQMRLTWMSLTGR